MRPLRAIAAASRTPGQFLADIGHRFEMETLDTRSLLGPDLARLAGAVVLIWSTRQLPAARALLELDGIARRILLCPPDLSPAHLPEILAEAEVDAIVYNDVPPEPRPAVPVIALGDQAPVAAGRSCDTEWILFTSGTTGRPKLVSHTLASLTGPLADGPVRAGQPIWTTFYDVRRYGGLQIFLRAMVGGGSLVLSQAGEPVAEFLHRAGAAGVSHALGTPTHWRRVLMSPARDALRPRYVRLSGEIADQAILDQLAQAYPDAELVHAYASTEAGVGFEVTDRLAGFPPSALGVRPDGGELRVVDGTIRVRSQRAASGYLGGQALADPDGFIDTGDGVAFVDGRYTFLGRRDGVINVGGQKLYPEEVEAVLLAHPAVRLAQVRGRPSPITGRIVVADVALQPGAPDFASLRPELLARCRAALPPHKVPAMLRLVDDISMAASGKLERRNA